MTCILGGALRAGNVCAQTFNESTFVHERTHAGDFLGNLSTILMYGLLSISFCAGSGLIIWGFVVKDNKDGNPQGQALLASYDAIKDPAARTAFFAKHRKELLSSKH